MARRHPRPHRDQLDLLSDWQPSQPVRAFAPETVRGASLAVSISKGVSQALKGCGRSREDAARLMSEYLDEKVSVDMLNAYASEAKSEHVVNVVRFVALLHVTRDRRLLELIAAMFDWAVIERKYLPAIEMAEAMEARAELDREIDARRRTLKKNGVL
ncbi:DNA transposition protein [Xanthobacter autotrophicus]|uniref:DNA transposition protein n=1 Tax=Xanthobacter TaxID=279 RepID=UPI0024ABE793|nr:DNA transposition protein [Xanthobacter autotrophicus]MDI4666735.1 DNA transposition protein [Xanthobacter autotrophicus]